MQLQTAKCDWNFSVLWLFLATVSCYLNCLSVQSLYTHTEHWRNLQQFFVLNNQTNRKHSTPSTFGFLHIFSEVDNSEGTTTLIMSPQYVCISFRYQPFFLNMVLPFLSKGMQVQTSSTTYINNINKAYNCLQLASEVSVMNCQEQS